MSYRLSRISRSRPLLSHDSSEISTSTRMARNSGTTKDEPISLDSDEDDASANSKSKPATRSTAKVIDLSTPSPPNSRTASRAPPRASETTKSGKPRPSQDRAGSASRESVSENMGAFALKLVPRMAGSSASSPPMEKDDADWSSIALQVPARATRQSSRSDAPEERASRFQGDAMDIDHTPSLPQIKASPQSTKRKRAEFGNAPELDGLANVPIVSIPSTTSKRTTRTSIASSRQATPPTNEPSGSTHLQSPKVKTSPQSQQKTNATQPESESDLEHAGKAAEVASPPPSSESDFEEAAKSPSPGKKQRVSLTRSRPGVSTRSSARSQAYTIGSNSPLVPRLQARKRRRQSSSTEGPIEGITQDYVESNEDGSEEQRPSVASFASALRSMIQDMKDNHAMSTRDILQKARIQSASAPSLAVDKVDPWANMKSIQITDKASLSATMKSASADNSASTKRKSSTPANKLAAKRGKAEPSDGEPMNSWIMSKGGKWSVSKSTQLAQVTTGNTPRVPRYSSHTNLSRNILSADSEKLKYVPYLGHEAEKSKDHDTNLKRLLKELQEAYSHGRIGSTRQVDHAFRISNYLEVWFAKKELPLSEEVLIHYILTQETAIRLGLRECDREKLLGSFSESLSEQEMNAAEAFWEAFDQVFNINLPNVVLPQERLEAMVERAKKASTSSLVTAGEGLGTYASLTCLICGAVDCQTHADYSHDEIPRSEASGDEQPESDWYIQRQPLVLPYKDMIRRHNERQKATLDCDEKFELPSRPRKHNPCSEDCWRVHTDDAKKPLDWDSKELFLLQESFVGLTEKEEACETAFAFKLPCWKVYCEMEGYVQRHDTPEVTEELSGRSKRPDWYDNKRKTLHSNFQEMTQAHLHQERSQANPCTHKGHCTNKCPCFEANILCESFCGCADDCPRRFTGCSCLSTGLNCVSETCICIQMNRECGPECVSCGAITRIDPAQRYNDDLFTWGCQNISLQRGVSKKAVAGESQLVGFGLYIAEDVRKGQFISEYKGEVISGQEAERRGILYDRKYLSFLFDLNRDYVIDAARYGNNTRFINHADSEKDGLNCEAKIILVNGEHRIKFVALRDITIGEELLFNYGKKFAEKHGLSKKLPKTTEVGKNGILPQGALRDALDGVDARQKSARGKAAAVTGRPKGGRGKHTKMRKTASSGRPSAMAEDLVPESTSQETLDDLYTGSQEVEDEEDEEAEADDEEQTLVNEGRGKRKITRPARYTR